MFIDCLTTADLSTVYLSSYSFASANCLTPTCRPMSTDYCRPVYHLPIPLHLPTCLPPTCQPVHLPYNQYAGIVYCQPVLRLPFFLFLYICQLPTCLSTADLSTYIHWLPPTCLLLTCLSIPLYLPTAYLSTTDLSTYVQWLPPTCLSLTCLSIPLYLPTAYLSTADLSIYVN